MRLDKKTRKRLYKAEGKAVLIDWPEGIPEALRSRSYPIFTEKGERAFRITVESVKRSERKALVKLDNDPHRILPGLAGTRNDAGDYESEPERVNAEFEDRLALEARAVTTVLGAEHRYEAGEKRQERSQAQKAEKAEVAQAKGWHKTVKTLERVRKAA